MSKEIICQICKGSFKNLGFGMHLKHKHQLTSKEYYDTYLKKNNDEGICKTCGGETTFLGGQYNKYCSNRCFINDPVIGKQRGEKCKETFRNNPEIMKDAVKKREETLKDNPEIIEKSLEKRFKTLEDNPEIAKRGAEKRLKTLEENPEIMIESGKATSIGLRNYYKSISKNFSEETHCLYIIENKTKPIVKIGMCGEKGLKRRIKEISTAFGESIPVLLLKSTHQKIDELETFLHDYFRKYCKVQPRGNGRTEWFDKKIMEEAKIMASSI